LHYLSFIKYETDWDFIHLAAGKTRELRLSHLKKDKSGRIGFFTPAASRLPIALSKDRLGEL